MSGAYAPGGSGYGSDGGGFGSDDDGGQVSAPTCPRHPSVVSYVTCQRCGRPACPQCQRPAPVGVQCVDCVRASTRTSRQVVTLAGGRAHNGIPYITYTIIAACGVLFVAQMLYPQVQWNLMFVPVLGQFEPWRFLTAAFLHGSIPHILFNMYALYLVGPFLEQALGRWRYAALYLLSALGGSVAVLLLASPMDDSWFRGVVGASGAVFGLFAALALTMRKLRRGESQILIIIGINVVLGFVIPNVSWQGHFGGLVVGAILGAAYLFVQRPRRTFVAVTATIGMLLVLVGAAVAAYL